MDAWAAGHRDAEGLAQPGVDAHAAVPEVDVGPVIAEQALALEPEEPPEALAAHVPVVARRLIVEATRPALAERADETGAAR